MDGMHSSSFDDDQPSDSVEITSRIVPRLLAPPEEELLRRQDSRVIPARKQQQLEADARRHWDIFYKRNSTKFFKDRHWTTREFQELSGSDASACERKQMILEVGCGVGNFVFPLMKEMTNAFFYACDFSARAIQFIIDNPEYSTDRCCAFCCDVTSNMLNQHIPDASIDIATLIFCLSAIHPDKMSAVLRNIYNVLRPGGCVLLRDYGLYDHAMLRFAPGHKLANNFYVRQDGTRAYYFSVDKVDELFSSAELHPVKTEYILRETVNRKEGLSCSKSFCAGEVC